MPFDFIHRLLGYEAVQLPPELSSWFPRYWFSNYFTFGGTKPTACDIRFPPIETNYVVAFLIPDSKEGGQGNPERRLYLNEIEAYGPVPKQLSIGSPTGSGPFIFGEMINLIASYPGNLTNISWKSDLDGNIPEPGLNITYDNLRVGNHTITLEGKDLANGQWVSATKQISIVPPEIEIVNLDGPGRSTDGTMAEVSYRKAKTHFKAIGHRPDGSVVDPYSVAWGLEGGVVSSPLTPLRFGVLSLLTSQTTIGDFEIWRAEIEKSPIATFVSYLPGNITVTAKRGTGVASIAVRIKQPTIRIDIHPIEGMDVADIVDAWALKAKEIWEKENIIKIESINLAPGISNVTYPNSPLTEIPPGFPSAELLMLSDLLQTPSYLNPLVRDYLSRSPDGKFYLPRQLSEPFMHRVGNSINTYVAEDPISYDWVIHANGGYPEFIREDVCPVSSREFNVFDSTQSGVVIRKNYSSSEQSKKILAQGMGRLLGLPKSRGWFQNFMDFGPSGGLNIEPQQIVAALNYNDDNPQNLSFIVEK